MSTARTPIVPSSETRSSLNSENSRRSRSLTAPRLSLGPPRTALASAPLRRLKKRGKLHCLSDRVKTLEEELSKLRRTFVSLLERVGNGRSDKLMDEIADRPMSDEELEAAFNRLDADADRSR